jgi:hypothetical protein
MKVMDTSIQNLAQLAEKLNQTSDLVTKQLEDFEAKLRSTKLGIQVWATERLNESTQPCETVDGGEFSYTVTETRQWDAIGWSRIGDSWRLIHKVVTKNRGWIIDLEKEFTQEWESEPQPLVNAPRMVRFQAISLLPQLVAALEKEANRHLNAASEFLTAKSEARS